MTETIEQNATQHTAQQDTEPASAKPRLLDQMRALIRVKHYSLRTEKTYLYWVKFFIRWSGMRHPTDMGAPEIESAGDGEAAEIEAAAETEAEDATVVEEGEGAPTTDSVATSNATAEKAPPAPPRADPKAAAAVVAEKARAAAGKPEAKPASGA